MKREILEEVNLQVVSAESFMDFEFSYPENHLHLSVWRITDYQGEAHGVEGQPIQWIPLSQLREVGMLAGSVPIINALLYGA